MYIQTKSVIEVSDELNRLTELAHQGKLGPSDISGGTFSLSNIGAVCTAILCTAVVTGHLVGYRLEEHMLDQCCCLLK